MKKYEVKHLYELLKGASFEQMNVKDIMPVITVLRELRPVAEQINNDIDAAKDGILTDEIKEAENRYNSLVESHTEADIPEMNALKVKITESITKVNDLYKKLLSEEVELTLTKISNVDTLITSNKNWKGEDLMVIYDYIA